MQNDTCSEFELRHSSVVRETPVQLRMSDVYIFWIGNNVPYLKKITPYFFISILHVRISLVMCIIFIIPQCMLHHMF